MVKEVVRWAAVARALLRVAARAGAVARACRADPALFALLVEEKRGPAQHPNLRFARDFKSLADVLIQQMVVAALAAEVDPGIARRVYGEESATFTSATTGETVTVAVGADAAATAAALALILPDHPAACTALAIAAHAEVALEPADVAEVDALGDAEVAVDTLGVWVDPLDGTNEFVAGHAGTPLTEAGLWSGGLPAVLVLLGIFDVLTGAPLLGVVYQPYCPGPPDAAPHGRMVWGGVLAPGRTVAPRVRVATPAPATLMPVALSSSEDAAVRARLAELVPGGAAAQVAVAGGGYKLLAVADGLAQSSLLSKPTIFQWDTCAVHALLRALGGDIVDCDGRPLRYDAAGDPCHRRGLVAYRDPAALPPILEALRAGLGA